MKAFVILLVLATLTTAFVGDETGAKWTFTTSPTTLPSELEVGDEFDLIFTAKLDKEWLLYSSDFKGDVGPQPTAFYFEPDDSFETVGEVKPIAPKRKKDRVWETDISYFTQRAEFRQRIRLLKPDYHVTGVIKGQLCSEKNGVCVPFERLFLF
jgi:thiol:disulfide interchange protein DsbD